VDNFATVATPIVAVYGDYELSALLSSLKVWIAKKRAEAQTEEARVKNLTNQGWDNMSYNYSF